MASLLCICDQGYRASSEEQDDTAIWMTHMLQKSDTRTALVLRGSAVNYANRAQRSVPLVFDAWKQTHPSDFPRDLERYRNDGGKVYVVEEDLAARGLGSTDLVEGVQPIARSQIAGLVAEYGTVSFW